MSDIQYVISVIVYEDGHCDVMWDSSVPMEHCYEALKQVTDDMAGSIAPKPPTPPKQSPKITRLK
ncbi:hypothetical protein Alches_15340 [Alicyclobacillus hesperidum subsp. aegles]|uniref:Uncharacterized protein n=1 Tax=Alicyclobacillus hesperidum TaxID=89784 RepID=A0A1H2QA20_9BACL|nr:hypothetical protein [Alicyclobacillus hesperidum]KRW92859.1 hypothetical protein SD51_00805 [Alicyclobacillus tengchongensis]GLG01495.1 hypothetical protein Alches_15340 [Alicyclobacillus hesperidum subsp. aegles]GLV12742.1 hypothetical protein Heshes_04260 [Alicyclobacillus hesperidum]SDW03780.1 hypothetical protein SAMN04489725_101153 [Alicyclobacillus hesperidum]